jgi:hypothetical protein
LAKNHDQAMKFEKPLLEQKLEAAIKRAFLKYSALTKVEYNEI